MSVWDKLTGRDSEPPASTATDGDAQAVERYRYLLRSAPPEQIEQAHAEAFARLSPEQRAQVLDQLGRAVPPAERAPDDQPASLARMATRAELRQPGILERSLGGGMGGVVAGALFVSLAGAFIGTAVAGALLDGGSGPVDDPAGGVDAAGDPGVDAQDGAYSGGDNLGNEFGSDFGGADFGGADFGGGIGA